MRGTGNGDGKWRRWSFTTRLLEGIPVDRARQRFTLTYALRNDLTIGLEANPLDDDYGPLLNWRVLDETEKRPALIIGTSSDRIGTPSGRAYYATLSKDLEAWTGLPIAPYAGAAFGEFKDEWKGIGGLAVRWAPRWTSTHLWDGENLHHVIDRTIGDRALVGLVAAGQDGGKVYLGLRFGLRF